MSQRNTKKWFAHFCWLALFVKNAYHIGELPWLFASFILIYFLKMWFLYSLVKNNQSFFSMNIFHVAKLMIFAKGADSPQRQSLLNYLNPVKHLLVAVVSPKKLYSQFYKFKIQLEKKKWSSAYVQFICHNFEEFWNFHTLTTKPYMYILRSTKFSSQIMYL